MAAWPGNVRALRNAVRQLVIAGHSEPRATLDEAIERLMDPTPVAAPATPGAPLAA